MARTTTPGPTSPRSSDARLRRRSCSAARWSPHGDRRDPGGSEQIHGADTKVPREPHEAMDCEVLPARFEAREVARAHPEALCERLSRPAAFCTKFCDPKADAADDLSGILAPHAREERALRLAKR